MYNVYTLCWYEWIICMKTELIYDGYLFNTRVGFYYTLYVLIWYEFHGKG